MRKRGDQTMTETCAVCGQLIRDKETIQNYKDNNLSKELWRCKNCIKDPIGLTPLFHKIENALETENREKWENMDPSLKAAFALDQIKSGNIQGGTAGHIESLRAIVASER